MMDMGFPMETVTRMACSCLFGIMLGTCITEYRHNDTPKPAVTAQAYEVGQTIAIEYGFSHQEFVVEQVNDGGYLLKHGENLRIAKTAKELAESQPFLIKEENVECPLQKQP